MSKRFFRGLIVGPLALLLMIGTSPAHSTELTLSYLEEFATGFANEENGGELDLDSSTDLTFTESLPELRGIFDGRGITLKNLSRPLFVSINEGEVKNLNLEVSISGGELLGGLAKQAINSQISNVSVRGEISGTKNIGGLLGQSHNSEISGVEIDANITGNENVGGVLGQGLRGTIQDSSFQGSVVGGVNVGGIVGQSGAQLTEIVTTTDSWVNIASRVETQPETNGIKIINTITSSSIISGISVDSANYTNVGGIVGSTNETVSSSTVKNSTISGVGNNVGGIAGTQGLLSTFSIDGVGSSSGVLRSETSGKELSNLAVTETTVEGNSNVGGLVGVSTDQIKESFVADTEVKVKSTSYYPSNLGGLVGNVQSGQILKSYSTANVMASGADNVGGLVGYLAGQVFFGFSTGVVEGRENVGGLVGFSYTSTTETTNLENTFSKSPSVIGVRNVGGLVGRVDGIEVTYGYVIYSWANSVVYSEDQPWSLIQPEFNVFESVGFGDRFKLETSGYLEIEGDDADLDIHSFSNLSPDRKALWGSVPIGKTFYPLSANPDPASPSWGQCSRYNSGYPFLIDSVSDDVCTVTPPPGPGTDDTDGEGEDTSEDPIEIPSRDLAIDFDFRSRSETLVLARLANEMAIRNKITLELSRLVKELSQDSTILNLSKEEVFAQLTSIRSFDLTSNSSDLLQQLVLVKMLASFDSERVTQFLAGMQSNPSEDFLKAFKEEFGIDYETWLELYVLPSLTATSSTGS